MRFCAVLVLIIALFSDIECYGHPNEKELRVKIDEIMEDALREQNLPGIGVAINMKGSHFYMKGYGYANIFKRTPITSQTLFGIGSCSKAMTAFAIMMLVEEGKINLKDSIRKYLIGPPPFWEKVTIEMLLSHTSGIPQHQGPHIPWAKVWSELANKPLKFAPGSDTEYNNFGYSVLCRLIEIVSKTDFSTFMRKRIFKPLMMAATSIPNEDYPKGLATGYRTTAKGIALNIKHKPWAQMWGSGGIVSNLSDFAKWDIAMTKGALLKPQTYDRMWAPVLLNDGERSGWCLGWNRSGIHKPLTVSKHGGITGYRAYIERHIEQGFSIILLSNTTPAKLALIAKKISQAIREEK